MTYFNGNRTNWGWGNTTTILGYTTRFSPLSEDQIRKSEKFFSGLGVQQSVAGFTIKLSRKVSVYIFDYFIPSGLFVVVSWVSLVIPPDAIPGYLIK